MKKIFDNHSAISILPVILVLLFASNLFGSSAETKTESPERGVNNQRTYSISDIENIGLYGGNLMLNVPLGSLPAGRGGMSSGINLRYNSKMWDLLRSEVTRFDVTYDMNSLIKGEDGGWNYGYKYSLKLDEAYFGETEGACNVLNSATFFPHKLKLISPDGQDRELMFEQTQRLNAEGFMDIYPDGRTACPNSSTPSITTGKIVFYSTDGSFLRLEVDLDSDEIWENNTWTLYSGDGTKVIHNPVPGVNQRVIDRNNNYIDFIENASDSAYSGHRTTTIKDQVNRTVVIEYEADENEDHIHSKGYDGAAITSKVKWKEISVNKVYYACDMAPSPLPQNAYQNFAVNQSFRVVEAVYLPLQFGDPYTYDYNYVFEYNVDSTSAIDVGWGEISKITTPSGSKAEYSYYYDNVSGSGILADEVLLNRPTQKQLKFDEQYDGATVPVTETWTYTPLATYDKLVNLQAVTITSPDGGTTTEHYFPLDSNGTNPPSMPEKVKGEMYKSVSSNGTIVEKIYQSNLPHNQAYSDLWIKSNRFVKLEFTSISNAAGSAAKTAIKEFKYDKNGNVTEVAEYDFVDSNQITRNSEGRPTGVPTGISPARISRTAFYHETPDAASTDYTDPDSYKFTTSKLNRNAVKSSETLDGAQTPRSRSELFYDNADTTGNLTESKVWDSYKNGTAQGYSNPLTSSNSISSFTTYDIYGNPVLITDANGSQTQITYGAVNGFSGLYPTQTISAYGTSIQRTSSAAYDYFTGLVTSSSDVDNNLTNATEYDAIGRPVKVKTAVGTPLEIWTQTEYNDILRRIVVRSDLEAKGDGKKIAVQHYDELGRVRLSRSIENAATEDPYNEAHGIKVQTRYQTGNPNSYQLTSNPYRAATSSAAVYEESMGWTRSKSVNTGRHSEVETFSGAALPAPWGANSNSTGKVRTDIDAEWTLVTDQSGKKRLSKTNALGQLTDVWEITTADSSTETIVFGDPQQNLNGYRTSYQYDILNNLTTVNQGVQTRSFSYSSLSRLLSAANPESGTISYLYDPNGNLTRKTDAREVQTDYVYDPLNRVTNRNYSTPNGAPANYQMTPNVIYTYDDKPNAKGLLTKISNGVSTTEYTEFDILGRVKAHKQTIDGQSYTTGYVYNFSGAMVEQVYPSGRVVKNVLDNDGQLSIVQSKKNANAGYFSYADSFTYTAAGAVSSMQLGNGKWESTQFNSRLQPTQIALGTVQGGTDKMKLDFTYNTPGLNNNNGNVLSQTITVPTETRNGITYNAFTATQNYSYDSLNRLKSATETIGGVQSWKQTFTFDRYGNRRFDEANTTTLSPGCATLVCNPQVDPATNKLIGYQFDNAGNTKVDAANRQFIYDGENKQVEVKDQYGVSIGKYFFDGDGKRVKKISATETTIFVYNASGQLVAEYSTQISQTPQVSYLTSDHLGSPRINTDENGKVIARHDFQPFGEEIQRPSYGADDVRQKFTTYERDNETDLDFAQARYFKSAHGRFTSPDPLLSSGRVEKPQTWNRYNYVLGNPLRYNDPLGLFEWDETTAGGSATDDDLQARSTDRNLTKKDRKTARRQLQFRTNFRAARQQAIDRVNSSNLSESEKNKALTAIGSYGEENDRNGVFVAVRETCGGCGATTRLREDGSILVSFLRNHTGDTLSIDLSHEGQHVFDADQFLSNREANGDSDLTPRQREMRAYEITSFVAQAFGRNSEIRSVPEAKYQVWNKGWAKLEEAERNSRRAKGIDALVSSSYVGYPESSPGDKYSQQFKPSR